MSRVLPILFNTDMVRAILDGIKTTTRRAIKNIYIEENDEIVTLYEKNEDDAFCVSSIEDAKKEMALYSRYQPGDILYVRETWSTHYTAYSNGKLVYCYKADGINLKSECLPGEWNRWHPSIHMPKEAARIWLKVTDVRVERLQDITTWEAKEEGVGENCIGISACGGGCKTCPAHADNYISLFRTLWNFTIKKSQMDIYGWEANPWVYVIEFERCEKPESEVEECV